MPGALADAHGEVSDTVTDALGGVAFDEQTEVDAQANPVFVPASAPSAPPEDAAPSPPVDASGGVVMLWW